jgi:paraquat-inducible protein A
MSEGTATISQNQGLTPENDFITARESGIFLCHDCHKLVADVGKETPKKCPRCEASLHIRKPNSITRTWALVITAAVLSLPANILPIMRVDFLGVADYSTIMDGIVYFFKTGSYGIGAVILTASVLVPCFKIIGIFLILLSIHFKWQTWLRHKTLMFRAIEFIGRWSMLDIFVIALLQALVKFGNITSIETAPAATFFTGVVISTMFAAITFDPRILWDA